MGQMESVGGGAIDGTSIVQAVHAELMCYSWHGLLGFLLVRKREKGPGEALIQWYRGP